MEDIIVIYWDGVRKIIKNVEDFGLVTGNSIFYIKVNGRRSYLPAESIRFIGWFTDYKTATRKEVYECG